MLAADPEALRHFDGVQRLARPVRGGEVEAWFLPAPGDGPRPVVVFAHGNGELIEHWPDMLAPYLQMGISVLLPEYRGYGRSAGWPSADTIGEDFRWFVEQVRRRPDVDASRFVLHGRSIGGGVVCALAQHVQPHAMVLWSTFTNIGDVAKRFGIPRFLIPDHFDNETALRDVRAPTFIVHGTQDLLIPVSHAHRLAAAARDAQLHLYAAGHNDCPPSGADHWRTLEGFLRDADSTRD